jgi:hypothetical protein
MYMQQPRNFRNVVGEWHAARQRLRLLTVMTLEPGPPVRVARIRALERHARIEARFRRDEVVAKALEFKARYEAGLNKRTPAGR